MNTAKIIRIACWAIVAIFLVSVLIVEIVQRDKNNGGILSSIIEHGPNWGLKISNGGRGTGRNNEGTGYVVGENYYVPVDDIDSINVEWISGEVFVEPYDGNEITFSEKAYRELKSDEKLIYEVKNKTLYIKVHESRGVSFFSKDGISKNLTIRIPAGLAGKLDDLQVSSVSGNIILNELCSRNTFLESTSGKIKLDGFVSEEVGVTSTSGDVNLSGTFDEIRIAVVSGDIMVVGESCPQKVSMVTVAGNAELHIPENDGFKVRFDNVSGSFSCEFPIAIEKNGGTYKDSSASITMETVSGDLKIKKTAD
ncbi:MAG: DUF4097 family beta strand repeat-containing protein [Eubacteriales bacterium]|jgi:lia operon protein LiaG